MAKPAELPYVSEKFSVYQVEPLGSAQIPLIITTGYRNAGGYFVGDFFLTIPDEPAYFLARRVTSYKKQFQAEAKVTLDEDFICRVALVRAVAELRSYVRKVATPDRQWLYAAHPVVSLAKPELLLDYSLACGTEHLIKIGRNTECEELNKYIEWILYLPKFEESDLGH